MKINKKNSGFTLPEVLTAIIIIGILAVVLMVLINSALMRVRDSRRAFDIHRIQVALESYYNKNNFYPTNIVSGKPLTDAAGFAYLDQVPTNPLPSDDGRCKKNSTYSYVVINKGTSYLLSYCLGKKASNNTVDGTNCAAPSIVSGVPGSFGAYPGNQGANPQPECNLCVCGDCETLTCKGLADFTASDDYCRVGDQTYHAVKVGDQCWLDQNVNLGQRLNYNNANNMTDDSLLSKWCFQNNEINPTPNDPAAGGCDTDGALYTWAKAMYLPDSCNSSAVDSCAASAYLTNGRRQGACPYGWHLPNDQEFTYMANYTTSTAVDSGKGNSGKGKGGGKNSNVPPVGQWAGTFDKRISLDQLWSSWQTNGNSDWVHLLQSGYLTINLAPGGKDTVGYNVRCLKD